VGPPANDRATPDSELLVLDTLRQRIKQADTHLQQTLQDDPRVQRLTTSPGVEHFFATLIVREIDGSACFARPKKLHAFAGLVPSTCASGGRQYHGRIIKAGSGVNRGGHILPA
jgi:transposase